MYKIAVVGGRDTVLGFKALGLDTYPVEDANEARHTFNRLSEPEEEYAIIYLEETFLNDLSSEIARLRESVTPAVILIPGRGGSSGLGLSALHEAVRRAVGADVL